MKAGIAGVGHLGYHHARIMKGLATETMIHDTDSERLKKVSEELGIKQAGSLEELVDWADALDVSCTTSAHYEVAMMALEKGVPVLVEKPLAATVEQGTEWSGSPGKGRSLSVGHIERFNPAMAAGEGYNQGTDLHGGAPDGWFQPQVHRRIRCDGSYDP